MFPPTTRFFRSQNVNLCRNAVARRQISSIRIKRVRSINVTSAVSNMNFSKIGRSKKHTALQADSQIPSATEKSMIKLRSLGKKAERNMDSMQNKFNKYILRKEDVRFSELFPKLTIKINKILSEKILFLIIHLQ